MVEGMENSHEKYESRENLKMDQLTPGNGSLVLKSEMGRDLWYGLMVLCMKVFG